MRCETARDRLSTFAAVVDTAAYAYARRALREGAPFAVLMDAAARSADGAVLVGIARTPTSTCARSSCACRAPRTVRERSAGSPCAWCQRPAADSATVRA